MKNRIGKQIGGTALAVALLGGCLSFAAPGVARAEGLGEGRGLLGQLLEERVETVEQRIEERREQREERLENAVAAIQNLRDGETDLHDTLSQAREQLHEDAAEARDELQQRLEERDPEALYQALADVVVTVKDKVESEDGESLELPGLLHLDLDVDLNTDDFLTDDVINHDININVILRSFDDLSHFHDHGIDISRSTSTTTQNSYMTQPQAVKLTDNPVTYGKPGTGMVSDPSWYSLNGFVPVDTGDHANPALWACLTVISGLGVLAFVARRIHRNANMEA